MNTLCLFNPRAGRFDRDSLERAFEGRGEAERGFWGEIEFISLAGGGRDWSERLEGFGRVAVFGGDGTVHHVIQRLAFGDRELCVFPAGTANDLTCAIGLGSSLDRNLGLFEKGKTIGYDTISVNGRHVITGGGFGLGYHAASSANRLRSGPLGGLFRKGLRAKVYLVTLAWHGLVAKPERVGFAMVRDGIASEGETQSILFCNQALMGKRVLIAPGTSALDGRFHLVRFLNRGAAGILRTLGHLKAGSKEAEPMLERFEVEEASIRFSEPVPAYGDGEEFAADTHWVLRCNRGAIRLRVPADFAGIHA